MKGDCAPDEQHSYKRGDVVRLSDYWGVVRRVEFGDVVVDWWTGQYAAGKVEEWMGGAKHGPMSNISAPFSDDYPGIPDEVWGRAAYYRLVVDEVME